MPKLTQTMEEGLIGRWHKKEGDAVEKGEPICEVETEKTVDEILAPESGILRKITAQPGLAVLVNQVVAIITAPDETLPELVEPIESPDKVVAGPRAKAETKIEEQEVKIPEEKKVKASPIAKNLAKEYGIDLSQIKSTGPDGRITREDVVRFVEEARLQPVAPSPPEGVKIIPITGMRKTIADRLDMSMKTALHVPLTIEVDMTNALKLLEKLRSEETRVHITLTDILVKVVAETLEEYPIVNSIVDHEQIKVLGNINIGVAVALEDGLLVPVIHDANKKSVTEISTTLKELTNQVVTKKSLSKESSGGTFTISNLGMFGVDIFAPIINPPESAILGVGRVAKKPVIIDDEIAVKSMMTMTLVFDHRVMDGAFAARFLQALKKKLETPQTFGETK